MKINEEKIFSDYLKKSESAYYNSDAWKCNKSETGSHYWLIVDNKYKKDFKIITSKCKYCQKEKVAVVKIS